MSNEEWEQLKAEGLCFICYKPGHIARNCPERNEVSSTEADEPPGIESFGINVDLGDIENQRELSIRSRDCELTVNNINILSNDDEFDDDIVLADLPETSAEFTARMRNYFVLLGPGERKTGGVGTGAQHNNESDSPNKR